MAVAYAYQSISMYAISFWGLGIASLWIFVLARKHLDRSLLLLVFAALGAMLAELQLISFMKNGILEETLRSGLVEKNVDLFDYDKFFNHIFFGAFKSSFASREFSTLTLNLFMIGIAASYIWQIGSKNLGAAGRSTAISFLGVLLILTLCATGPTWRYPIAQIVYDIFGAGFFKSANYYGIVFTALPTAALLAMLVSHMQSWMRLGGIAILVGLIILTHTERLYRQFVYYGAGQSFRQTFDSPSLVKLADVLVKERVRAVTIVQDDHAFRKFNQLMPRLYSWPLWASGGQTGDGFSQIVMRRGWEVFKAVNTVNIWNQMWQIEFPIKDELVFDQATRCITQQHPIRLSAAYNLAFLAYSNVGYVVSNFVLESPELEPITPAEKLPETKRCGSLSQSAINEVLGNNQTIPVHVYRLKSHGDRYFISRQVLIANNDKETVKRMRNVPDKAMPFVAVVSANDADRINLTPRAGIETGPGSIAIVEGTPDIVKLKLSLDSDAFVVARTHYSKFWTATVDGKPSPVIPANLASIGTKVPRGTHEVVFEYVEPPLFD
ncbi:MAG: hypothetical protein HOI45_02080 [Rhodospirillaceae bacterium]|jgi:hypothetical protein|nr:hypothetical protein [Rhodospirillaceae bacterium]